jgi:hypothetical protein
MKKPLQQKKYSIKEHLSDVDHSDEFEGMSDDEILKYLDKIEQEQESLELLKNKRDLGN